MERYERNVTVESILRSQQPPERREPPLSRGRWVGGEGRGELKGERRGLKKCSYVGR